MKKYEDCKYLIFFSTITITIYMRLGRKYLYIGSFLIYYNLVELMCK